jgi:hypothetical protein
MHIRFCRNQPISHHASMMVKSNRNAARHAATRQQTVTIVHSSDLSVYGIARPGVPVPGSAAADPGGLSGSSNSGTGLARLRIMS